MWSSQELSPGHGGRVREHLIRCPSCRSELAEWMRQRGRLRAFGAEAAAASEQPVSGLARAVLARVAQEPTVVAQRSVLAARRRWWVGSVAAVGLFGLGLAIGVGDGDRTGLVHRPPLSDSRPSAVDSGSVTRQVGLRSRQGLMGRDRAVQGVPYLTYTTPDDLERLRLRLRTAEGRRLVERRSGR
jgi:anti-sigma factor RsiW